jgi:hypothetical protein
MPMKKRKWLIPVVVSMVLVGGIVGGVVVAADQSQTTDRYQGLLDRACAVYEEQTGVAIDSGWLRNALDQAHSELQEEALQSRLQDLVDEGKMTQEEADQYLEWWQSRPDIELPLPGLGGHGPRGGMMWGRGFQPWGGPGCASDAADGASD